MDYGGDVEMKNKYHCWVLWRGYNHDIIISSLPKGKKNNFLHQLAYLYRLGTGRRGRLRIYQPEGSVGVFSTIGREGPLSTIWCSSGEN